MSHLDLSLLGALVLFPCWSYLPPKPGGSASEVGYLEILTSPVPVVYSTVREISSEPAAPLLTPGAALLLLNDRSRSRHSRVSVAGEVCRVTSLVNIRQKTFFFFFLKNEENCVPVIVQTLSKLTWYHALHVGEKYAVTLLSVSSLRGSPHKVFSVTSASCLLSQTTHSPPPPGNRAQERPEVKSHPHGQEEEVCFPREIIKDSREKEAKTLTYQGVLTKVLDPSAGLYELDGKVVLCTAYLQLLNRGRGLREGAKVKVFDAHFQQSPSPLFPTMVISCCLRSRIQVSEFSQLCSPSLLVSAASNLLLHLLFRYQLRLPEYLWVSNITKKLREKFCPLLITQRCLAGPLGSGPPGLVENLLSQTLSSLSIPGGRCERDLQGEILGKPHDCPLQKYTPLSSPWSLPPLSVFSSLVSETPYLHSEEMSQHAHWSIYALRPEDLPTPPLLVGVFYNSSSGDLKLKDQMLSLHCLVVPRPPIAWIGCILEVSKYELITEKIQETSKEESRSRTYVVFCTQNVRVIHQPDNCSSCLHKTSCTSPPCKVPRIGDKSVSRLFKLERLEGRQTNRSSERGFQFHVHAAWVGPPLLSEEKPDFEEGNETMEGESQRMEQDKPLTKVVLLFSGSSVRWYHFLQPNRVYRLIATGETDMGIFDSLSASPILMSNCSLCLRVPSEWTLQDVDDPKLSLFPVQEVLSVEDCSKNGSTGLLLSVTGVVSNRFICESQNTCVFPSRTRISDFLPHGVTLKVTLTENDSHVRMSAYIDPSWGPYPLGLLPGVTILLQGLERKVSRSGSVYLRSVPVTCVSILSTPTLSSENPSPPPLSLFTNLPGPLTLRRAVCSVSCVLSLTLRWVCSMCGDTFREESCERSPSCSSTARVFKAKAKVKADDGSAAVMVQLQDDAVSLMLAVPPLLWESLKGRVLSRGEVTFQYRGRNAEFSSEEECEDPLLKYVTYIMSRPSVSRPLLLTFTLRGEATGPLPIVANQQRRFTRGERDYISYVPTAPTITCLQLQELGPRQLCDIICIRSKSDTK